MGVPPLSLYALLVSPHFSRLATLCRKNVNVKQTDGSVATMLVFFRRSAPGIPFSIASTYFHTINFY
jgi:hypothetical protein